jgi:CRISPR/Cas system-associated protein Csm6
MCEKCAEIDILIGRYRQVKRSISDQLTITSTTLAESFCAEVLHEYVSDNVGTVETAAKG